jgi:hypothetical protein
MLESERLRMMRAGLCFRCGAQGHLLRDCPQKPNRSEATRISELEAELAKLKGRTGKTDGGEKGTGSKNGGAQA